MQLNPQVMSEEIDMTGEEVKIEVFIDTLGGGGGKLVCE